MQLSGLSQVKQLSINKEQRSQLLLEALMANVSFEQEVQRVSFTHVRQLSMILGQ